MHYDYDYIIIGSGFGGSVSALRLSEKGYKVLVIEKGKWFKGEDFPKTTWNLPRWMWFPKIGLKGIMKMTFYRHMTILSGVGVGGGSLVYASTLPVPKKAFFESGAWKGLADWETELKPYYQEAQRMLGADRNPRLFEGDLALKELAEEIGKAEKFSPTDVGIYFGQPGKEVEDPFFEGEGPRRTGCIHCGACMTGCRHNAKNSLDKNYLYLAQKLGAEVLAEHEVFDVRPVGKADDGSEGYAVHFKKSTGWFGRRKSLRTRGIVFSGGVLGTVKLLLKLKEKGSLPRLSNRLGFGVRSNNESLIPVTTIDRKKVMSRGVAIGSILHTDDHSHLEAVRYGEGSGFWRLLLWPLAFGPNGLVRLWRVLKEYFTHPIQNLKAFFTPDWAKATSTLLFMQSLDSTLRFKLAPWGMKTAVEEGPKPSAFIPAAQDLATRYSRILNGKPSVFMLEPLLGTPSTAHILGGACMGADRESGVIDKDNRVFGYRHMLVCDGSMISANPGVNPSLSITAIAERAMSKVPSREKAVQRRSDQKAQLAGG